MAYLSNWFRTAVVWIIVSIPCSESQSITEQDQSKVRCQVPQLAHSQLPDGNDSVSVNTVIRVKCDEGYQLTYSKAVVWHIICRKDGVWSNLMGDKDFHTCQRVGVCPIPHFAHASIKARSEGYMPQQSALFTCDDGYMLPNGLTRTYLVCFQDGTWTHAECVEKHCLTPAIAPHVSIEGIQDGYWPDGARIHYCCAAGFRLSDESAAYSRCSDGRWTGASARCVEMNSLQSCPSPDAVHNADTHLTSSGDVDYICHAGYTLVGSRRRLCVDGQWVGDTGICVPSSGYPARCRPPPSVPNADYMLGSHSGLPQYDVQDGTNINYFCHYGYRMTSNVSTLVCKDEIWHGILPKCVKRTSCDTPMDIKNGNWVIRSQFPNFNIGADIEYECDMNYKIIGSSILRCLSTGYWSEYTPQCKQQDLYCSEPGPIANGYYMCKPSHCNMFKVGTELHYVCNDNYEARASDDLVQKCVNGGFWTGDKPLCVPARRHVLSSRLQLNTGTMTIVVATSCSILGLLLVVMLVVALQRRIKLSSRLHVVSAPPAIPPPPPYCPLAADSTSEHDRVALIAFADGSNATLPTYEEAVRSRAPGRRTMPSIGRDQHRASVVTATSSARDNLSLPPYGSIDTINASDGTSTSVTIDTYDSAASNPSLAVSQRAAAGSIASSNESLANEDAPLLEPHHSQAETSWSNNCSRDTVSTTASDLKDA